MDAALEQLERSQPERARVVVMKFFCGLTNKEVADMLGISERSVDRHWMCAKAWLFQELQDSAQ